MSKRRLTPAYIFFFVLFWPDTWRIAIGILSAWLLLPYILPADPGPLKAGLLFIMTACIGYAAAAIPARAISRLLRKTVLGITQRR